MKTASIRRSLVIRCGAGVGLLLCLLSTGIYLTVRHGLYAELDRSIEQTAALLADQVELENESITYEWQEGMGTNKSTIDSGLFQFWDESTGITTRSPGLQMMNLPRFCGPDGSPVIKDIRLPGHHRWARAIGLRIYPFVLPEELERMKARGRMVETKNIPHILVVARDSEPAQRVLARMRWILSGGTLLTLAVGFFLIHRATRASLTPIDELTAQVKEREGRHLDSPLSLPHTIPAELCDLTESFNTLLSRLARTRRREGDFLRHAAHELRTPIAELLATTDLALSQPRDETRYRKHLEDCRTTAENLGALVNKLFALAQSEPSNSAANPAGFDLAELTASRLRAFRRMFESRGLTVESQLPADSTVTADPALTAIILNNLLDNAASHADVDSAVSVTVTRRGTLTDVTVANESSQLPGDLERLFEPLFRNDKSRAAGTSHLGVGLTLSRNAATQMGAPLTARRTGTNRVEFILTLPTAGV